MSPDFEDSNHMERVAMTATWLRRLGHDDLAQRLEAREP